MSESKNNNLYEFKEDFHVENNKDSTVTQILNNTNQKVVFNSENNNKLWLQEDWDDLEVDEEFINNLKSELEKNQK
ncbi:hypothetical protein HANVADRAFT_51934 [Hanseniaspora valbyensis NRRL Y-1626]|uniref:Uncharacterized protein n=1 Tax=Hanseniaspora valbyensis NRRL Y-1626 TaxID=766949 RepID=A0A1B7TGE0_9ASCO|nr:hypothetical protein HANVADRAFT_51934 [Hanseniaspora valbyensis NRRL Y-1626]